MARRVPRERKGAEDRTVIQAPADPRDPREKWATVAPQVHLPTSLTPPSLKVTAVTQDSQGPTGSREARANQETRAPRASPARRSEMKMGREAYQVKWAPKAS